MAEGKIRIEGYTFLYSLLLMETTRRQMTNVATPGESAGRGPADVFVNVRAFPPGDFRDVVRPNFDTLYSIAWLDLHDEPRIVYVPSAGDNYCSALYHAEAGHRGPGEHVDDDDLKREARQ